MYYLTFIPPHHWSSVFCHNLFSGEKLVGLGFRIWLVSWSMWITVVGMNLTKLFGSWSLKEDIYWKTLHIKGIYICCGDESPRRLYFNLFVRLVRFCEFKPYIGVWCADRFVQCASSLRIPILVRVCKPHRWRLSNSKTQRCSTWTNRCYPIERYRGCSTCTHNKVQPTTDVLPSILGQMIFDLIFWIWM